MDLRAKALFHQIHPVKLATDVAAGVVSTWLFWERWPPLGLAVGILPSVLVSAWMLRSMDFEAQRDSAFGAYLARRMTPTA